MLTVKYKMNSNFDELVTVVSGLPFNFGYQLIKSDRFYDRGSS
jgi:hypothetical protein